MAKEKHYPVTGADVDNESDMGDEIGEEIEEGRLPGRHPRSYYDDYAQGYNKASKGVIDDKPHSNEEVEQGYEVLGDLDFDDPFGAFCEPNYGLVGGACTVDDYSPEGVTDRSDRGADPQDELGVGGAHRKALSKRYP